MFNKQTILNFVSLLFSTGFLFLLKIFIFSPEKNIFLIISLILLFLISQALLNLSCLLTKKKILIYGTGLILSILFLILFGVKNLYLVTGSILSLFALASGYQITKREKDQRKKIFLYRILGRGMYFIYLFLIFFALFSFCFGQKISIDKIKVSEKSIDPILKILEKPITSFIPEFKKEATIDGLIEALIFENLEKQADKFKKENPQPEMIVLIEEEKNKMKEKTLKETKENLSKTFGIEIQGNEKISNLVAKTANFQIENWIKPYKKYLPLAIFLILFSALSTLKPFLSIFIILFYTLIFKFLKKMKIVEIVEKEEKNEKISF